MPMRGALSVLAAALHNELKTRDITNIALDECEMIIATVIERASSIVNASALMRPPPQKKP